MEGITRRVHKLGFQEPSQQIYRLTNPIKKGINHEGQTNIKQDGTYMKQDGTYMTIG